MRNFPINEPLVEWRESPVPRCDEKFALRGKWWLPERPDLKVDGLLKHVPGRVLELETEAHLPFPEDDRTKEEERVIFGQTGDFMKPGLVLVDAFKRGYSGSRDRFGGFWLMIGDEIGDWSSFQVSGFHAGFSGLEQWWGREPFKIVDEKRDKGIGPTNVRFEPSEGFEADSNALDEKYYLTNTASRSHVSFESVELKNHCDLAISRERKSDALDWVQERHFALWQLLTFLTGQSIEMTSLSVHGSTKKFDGRPSSWAHWTAYRPLKIRDYQGARLLAGMLFSAPTLKDTVGNVFVSWFEKADATKPLRNALFAIMRDEYPFLETQFLALVQALEGYSRSLAPTVDRKLKDRILALIADVDPLVRSQAKPNPEVFAESVVATRDNLTHLFPTPPKPHLLIGERDLYPSLFVLQSLAMSHLLGHAGLNAHQVARGLQRIGWIP
jgi:hypothetical protein